MKIATYKTTLFAGMLLLLAPVQGLFAQSVYEKWQIQRMFEPAESQLILEYKGRVFIYEGITDKTISMAMDQEFDRIQNMMFVGTVITDKKGKPQKDPVSGQIMREDDDC